MMPFAAEMPSGIASTKARATQPWASMAPRLASSILRASQDESTFENFAVPRPWRVGAPIGQNCSEEELVINQAEEVSSDSDSSEVEVVQESAQNSGPLTPAPRGTRQCLCHGEVLTMFGHYGWLVSSQPIDHPARCKNNGRIYLHMRDVEGDLTLVEGDQVSFYLYVDDQGLGAEGCCLWGWSPEQACAAQERSVAPQVSGLNPQAAEFVPAGKCLAVSAPAPPIPDANPYNVFVINEAYWSWSDFSDDEDDEDDDESECDGDVESSCEHVPLGSRPRRMAKPPGSLNASFRSIAQEGKPTRAHSCDSDSTGVSSDSEISSISGPGGTGVMPPLNDCPPPGLMHPGIRPPPGLSLP